jgi:plastocyanin
MVQRAFGPALVVASAALALAGCGTGESSGGGYRSGPTSKGHQGSAAPAPAAAKAGGGAGTVTMANIAFHPTRVTVRVGQAVQWSNEDGVPHTVKAVSGPSFQSGTIQPGQHYRYQPARPGRIDYVCTIHPNMKGTIEVTKG